MLFDVCDKLPEPNVQLWVRVAENPDHVGGGAAMYGEDGKWYWTCDGKKTNELLYQVIKWEYLVSKWEHL